MMRFAAAFNGDVSSAQFIQSGALISSLQQLSLFGSEFNFNSLRNLLVAATTAAGFDL